MTKPSKDRIRKLVQAAPRYTPGALLKSKLTATAPVGSWTGATPAQRSVADEVKKVHTRGGFRIGLPK